MGFFRNLFSSAPAADNAMSMTGQPVEAVNVPAAAVPQLDSDRLARTIQRIERLRTCITQEEARGTPDHLLTSHRRELKEHEELIRG